MNFKIKVLLAFVVFYGATVCCKAIANTPLSVDWESALQNFSSDVILTRKNAIVTLKEQDPQLENPTIREKIVAFLEDPSPEVQKYAIWALRDIADPNIEKKLLDFLAHGSDRFRKKRAILALADNVEFKLHVERENDALLDISPALRARVLQLISDYSYTVRRAVAMAFSGTRDPHIQAQIVQLFSDKNSQVRQAALIAIKDPRDPQVQDQIAALFSSSDPEMRRMAIVALSDVDTPAIQLRIVKFLSPDEPPEVRKAAFLALKGARDPQVQDQIAALFSSSDPEIRRMAVVALSDVATVATQLRMLKLLSPDEPPEVRKAAFLALRDVPDHAIQDKILELLSNPSPQIRAFAVFQLNGGQNVSSALSVFLAVQEKIVESLSDPNEDVRKAARHVLRNIENHPVLFDKLAPQFVDLLPNMDSKGQLSIMNKFVRRETGKVAIGVNGSSVERDYFVFISDSARSAVANLVLDPDFEAGKFEVRRAALELLFLVSFTRLEFELEELRAEYVAVSEPAGKPLSDRANEFDNRIESVMNEFQRKYFMNSNPEIRLAGIQALSRVLVHSESNFFDFRDYFLNLIIPLISDPRHRVKRAALKALPLQFQKAPLPSEYRELVRAIQPEIVKQLSDNDVGIRLAGMQALNHFGFLSPTALSEVAKRLFDESEEVRLAGIELIKNVIGTLSHVNSSSFIDFSINTDDLRESLRYISFHDPSLEVKKSARQALQSLQNISDSATAFMVERDQATGCLRVIQRRRFL